MTADDLAEAGIVRMQSEEIGTFLATRGSGVLGLPAENAPYLLPMSYGYDGGDRLYFTYVRGSAGRKGTLSDRASAASFLVHRATTPFQWQSVLLEGTIDAVDPAEYDAVGEALSEAWRPHVFEDLDLTSAAIYRFSISERSGMKQTGLPPALQSDADGSNE